LKLFTKVVPSLIADFHSTNILEYFEQSNFSQAKNWTIQTNQWKQFFVLISTLTEDQLQIEIENTTLCRNLVRIVEDQEEHRQKEWDLLASKKDLES
jgi:hypothetical protein